MYSSCHDSDNSIELVYPKNVEPRRTTGSSPNETISPSAWRIKSSGELKIPPPSSSHTSTRIFDVFAIFFDTNLMSTLKQHEFSCGSVWRTCTSSINSFTYGSHEFVSAISQRDPSIKPYARTDLKFIVIQPNPTISKKKAIDSFRNWLELFLNVVLFSWVQIHIFSFFSHSPVFVFAQHELIIIVKHSTNIREIRILFYKMNNAVTFEQTHTQQSDWWSFLFKKNARKSKSRGDRSDCACKKDWLLCISFSFISRYILYFDNYMLYVRFKRM